MASPSVPAADATLRLLSHLATQRSPIPAARIAADLGLARSRTYDLLAVLIEHGYVLHLPEQQRYALGPAAYEVAAGYARHDPLARVGGAVMARLVDTVGESGHLAVLRGTDCLYIVEERARNRPSLVTDLGVRLPAHIPASGRALLAQLPAAQLRSLYPKTVQLESRTGHGGIRSRGDLVGALERVRADGVSRESGEVTEGFGSVAAAVVDAAGWPVAAIALTWEESRTDAGRQQACERAVQSAAQELERILSG